MRCGHIPNSINIPFTSLLTQNTLKNEEKSFTNKAINNKYLNEKQLKAVIDEFIIDPSSELVFSCGSGVTACVVLFVFYCLGYQNICVYDGSWSEWGANDQLPISKAK